MGSFRARVSLFSALNHNPYLEKIPFRFSGPGALFYKNHTAGIPRGFVMHPAGVFANMVDTWTVLI